MVISIFESPKENNTGVSMNTNFVAIIEKKAHFQLLRRNVEEK